MIQKLPVRPIVAEAAAHFSLNELLALNEGAWSPKVAAATNFPLNVLLALDEGATSPEVARFNLPGAVNSLLGDWQRAVKVMSPKIWVSGWNSDQFRHFLYKAQPTPPSLPETCVEGLRASSFLGFAGTAEPKIHEIPNYAVVHCVSRMGVNYNEDPFLSLSGCPHLSAGILRDALVTSGTRLLILQSLDETKIFPGMTEEKLAKFIVGAGGPAVLIVLGGDVPSLNTYLFNLYSGILCNRPLDELAQAENNGPKVLLLYGEGGNHLLQFNDLMKLLGNLLHDYSSLVEKLLPYLRTLPSYHIRRLGLRYREAHSLEKLGLRIDSELKRLNEIKTRPWDRADEGAIFLSELVEHVSSITKDIGLRPGEGPLHTKYDQLEWQLGELLRREEWSAGGGRLHARESREITVTAHALDGAPVFHFKEGDTYRLRFRVGPPIAENLAEGYTAVEDVPKGGLQTHWVVTSTDLEFVPELSIGKVRKIGGTWLAEFALLIPEWGSSKTVEIAVLVGELDTFQKWSQRFLGAKQGNLLVTIYAVSAADERELYREVSISLSDEPYVEADETFKAPQYTHLRPTHDWTTPAEHIQVSIRNGVVEISTIRFRLEKYELVESFAATDNLISGAIHNVRDSLEKFREFHEAYLNDLDHGDIAARLAGDGTWQPHSQNVNGWHPLPDQSDFAHKAAFSQVQQTDKWRALASDGYALFEACFPKGTKLRDLLKKLLPGSRIDFHWTEQSGPGWVSHVPWALMYMEPVDVTGQTPADPEKFLGLRFRIGTHSWYVDNPSVVLGGLDTTNWMHLMYWGNKPGDVVAIESQWQAVEYKKWKQSRLLPDTALPDLKEQIVAALDKPGPSPVSVLYFYCHCSVGDGAQPCLRFGNTSKREDTIDRLDLSQRDILDGPIIFANACSTAQADPHMTSELEQRFFRRGVRAFIGTEVKVPIKLASKFAWLYFQFFYRRADPDPMAAGEALTQARIFLWTQYKNVGGLFYCMANQYDLYLASDQEVLALSPLKENRETRID